MILNLWALLFGAGADSASTATPGVRPLRATFAERDFQATFQDDPLMPKVVIITTGETREPIGVTLTDHDGDTPMVLTGATVTAHLQGIGDPAQEYADIACNIVNEAATVEDDDCGAIEIPLTGTLATVVVDEYQVRIKADFGGGLVQWWPTKHHLVMRVRPKFAEL